MRVRKNLQMALAICAAVLVFGWGTVRLARWRIDRVENRRVEVVREEIEARSHVTNRAPAAVTATNLLAP